MTDPDQDELVALRRRAYGRDADIHLDPASLARLDELENARTPAAVDEVDASPTHPPEVERSPIESPPDEVLPEPWWDAVARRVGPWVVRFGRWLRGLRRSTVLIAVGAALVVASLLTVLTLVQRVQSDPLQVGAVQVARLSVDRGYENPFDAAGSLSSSGGELTAYDAFHGLRAITGRTPYFYSYGSTEDSTCLTIFVESTLDVQGNGFSGTLFSSCEAGDFPAMLQFPLAFSELPSQLAATYPDAHGIQFVYDAENDEVVVFVDR